MTSLSTEAAFAPAMGVHGRWVAEVLRGATPPERLATCHQCAMCQPMAGGQSHDERQFSPTVKCCTYWPVLPNYLVGAVLAGRGTADGRQRMVDMIAHPWALPVGVGAPPWYQALYSTSSRSDFGRSERLLCPYYSSGDGGTCTIWESRNAVCSTYFCKHERGKTGHQFWISVHQFLACVERILSQWCCLQLGVPVDEVAQALLWSSDNGTRSLESFALDGSLRKPDHFWTGWEGAREEFYLSCDLRVRSLSWRDLQRLGGLELESRASRMMATFAKLTSADIPTDLRMGRFAVAPGTAERILVSTYRASDAQLLRLDVFASLTLFDGRPVRDAVRSAESEFGVVLTDDELRQLVDHCLLVEGPVLSEE